MASNLKEKDTIVFVCEKCLLLQTQKYGSAETMFSESPYFPSFADVVDNIVGQTFKFATGASRFSP